MSLEEGEHSIEGTPDLRFFRLEVKAMSCTWQHYKLMFDACRDERLPHQDGLLIGNIIIMVTVEQDRRRIVGRYVTK